LIQLSELKYFPDDQQQNSAEYDADLEEVHCLAYSIIGNLAQNNNPVQEYMHRNNVLDRIIVNYLELLNTILSGTSVSEKKKKSTCNVCSKVK
jgi:hypothetical protein